MAITYDTKAEIAETTGTPNQAFTCGANAKLLIVHIATDTNGTRTGGAPTYDGVELIEVGTQADTGGEGTAELWYMEDPPVSQSLTINVPNAAGGGCSVYMSTYNAAAGQIITYDTYAFDNNSTADPALAVTPTNADSLIVNTMFSGDGTTPTGNSDQLLYQYDTGQEGNGCQYKLNAPASSNTLTWTIPADDWQMVVAVFYERNPFPLDINVFDSAVSVAAITVEKAAEFKMSLSDNITASGENTTYQLTPPATKSNTDFVAGRIQDDENPADTVDIPVDDYTELEWSIEATDLSILAQYDFRVTIDGVALDTYGVTPKLTITAGVADRNINVSDNVVSIEDISSVLDDLSIYVSECIDSEDTMGKFSR